MAAAIEPTISATAELDELFREQHARVLKAAYRITGSMSDAEDVAQNVFLRIVQRGDCRTAIANPDWYVYRAAINGALDLIRRRQRENAAGEDAVELLADGRSTERATQAREAVESLRLSLGQLSPRAAEMFVLRYVEERDIGEIARLMGTSRAVVAVTLHRARARLRQDLASHMRGRYDARR